MKIPTLHSGTREVVSTLEDKIAYILRHTLTNPGYTSDMIEDELISFRKLEALHDGNVEELKDDYKKRLEIAILNVTGVRVEVILETKELDPQTKQNLLDQPNAGSDINGDKYSLEISVVDIETGIPIVTYGKIIVNSNDIIIDFDGGQ